MSALRAIECHNPGVMSVENDASPLTETRPIADTLRRHIGLCVGAGKKISWADLSIALDESEPRLRKLVRDDETRREVRLGLGLRIAAILGPRTVNALLAMVGYGHARPLEIAETSPADLVIAAADLIGEVTAANADGVWTYSEINAAEERLTQMRAQLEGFVVTLQTKRAQARR